MTDDEIRKLIATRMKGPGNYFTVADIDLKDEALRLARPGDTISLHPKDPNVAPTIYEVQPDRTLKKLGGPDAA